LRIGIGEKSLAKGEVELKPRGGQLIPVKAGEAAPKALEWVTTQMASLNPAA
jgi:hypothetical protein